MNDVKRVEEILPTVLQRLPCACPWERSERWNDVSDICIGGAKFRALEWAARKVHIDIVKFLCSDERTKSCIISGCPVAWACYTDHVEVAKLLVSFGADDHATNDCLFGSSPPLLIAAENGSIHSLKWLVDVVGHDMHVVYDGKGIIDKIYHGALFMAKRQDRTVDRSRVVLTGCIKDCLDWAVGKGAVPHDPEKVRF